MLAAIGQHSQRQGHRRFGMLRSGKCISITALPCQRSGVQGSGDAKVWHAKVRQVHTHTCFVPPKACKVQMMQSSSMQGSGMRTHTPALPWQRSGVQRSGDAKVWHARVRHAHKYTCFVPPKGWVGGGPQGGGEGCGQPLQRPAWQEVRKHYMTSGKQGHMDKKLGRRRAAGRGAGCGQPCQQPARTGGQEAEEMQHNRWGSLVAGHHKNNLRVRRTRCASLRKAGGGAAATTCKVTCGTTEYGTDCHKMCLIHSYHGELSNFNVDSL
eukprot:1160341-Pelagomonas_calceolata.AAC.2